MAIEDRYLNWLYAKVSNANGPRYSQLFSYLFNIEFIPMDDVPLDENRLSDVDRLRSMFASETGLDVSYLNNHLYSLLEVMVYLSIIMERDIMSDSNDEDRTDFWFYSMLESSGLNAYYDGAFSAQGAGMVCDRIIFRRYRFNGVGGLFTVRNPQFDMTLADLYRQMMWYLNDIYPFED